MKHLLIAPLAALAMFMSAPSGASASSDDPGCYETDYVGPNQVKVFYVTFHGLKEAIVELTAADSDVDLWIYDEHGNLIAKSTSDSGFEYVSWTPKWTGKFKIVVENRHKPNGSHFTLCTT